MSKSFAEGVYSGMVLDHRLEKASTGTPQFVMSVRIVGKVGDDGQVQPCPSAERSFKHSIGNEASIQRLSLELRRVLHFSDLNQLAHKEPGGSGLVGKTIKLTCYLEPLDGRMVERWGILRSEPLAADEVQSLQCRFGDVLQRMNARFAPPANGSSEPSAGGPDAEPAAHTVGQPAVAQTA